MENVSHPFSLRFEGLGFLFSFVFFPLFLLPHGIRKTINISPPFGVRRFLIAAKGAFRHHGAVDGITRCLGDGGHSPPPVVRWVGWGDGFWVGWLVGWLVREVVTVFQMEIIFGKKLYYKWPENKKGGCSIVLGGCTSGFGLVGRMGCC